MTEEDYFAAAYEEELAMEEEAATSRGAEPDKAPDDAMPSPHQKPTSPRASSTGANATTSASVWCPKRAGRRRSTTGARNKSCRRRARPSRMMVSVCCDCRLITYLPSP